MTIEDSPPTCFAHWSQPAVARVRVGTNTRGGGLYGPPGQDWLLVCWICAGNHRRAGHEVVDV